VAVVTGGERGTGAVATTPWEAAVPGGPWEAVVPTGLADAVVHRVGSGEGCADAPDYAPLPWPDPLPLTAHRPLDPLGTVLIPPAARAVVPPRPNPATSPQPGAPTTEPAAVPRPDPSLGSAAERELSADRLVRQRPSLGRRLAFRGERGDQARQLERIRTPLRRAHRVAVLGCANGTGQSTATAALGALLATHRQDRVLALALGAGTAPTELPEQPTYQHFRRFTTVRPGGLEVLASGPADQQGYQRLLDAASGQYPVVLADTGGSAPAVRAAVATADQLVICADASVRGAGGTDALLGWLTGEGYGRLVAGAVLVVSPVPGEGRALPGASLAGHFASRCRAVVAVPVDAHLAAGGDLVLDRLRGRTRGAYLELAALVGDALGD
jgi:MinD-like ATPase involved in chromosome partitioning or flagellar assembly